MVIDKVKIAPATTPRLDVAPVAQVVEELNDIVGRARRTSSLRRVLRSFGIGFLNRLERLMPPPSREPDPPPVIRFPFF